MTTTETQKDTDVTGRFKQDFELGLQTWTFGHFPDHDHVLAACEELGIRHVDIGDCHFEFIAPHKSFAHLIKNRVEWLNRKVSGFTLRYDGALEFPADSFIVPRIKETHAQRGDVGPEVVFEYVRTDYETLAAQYRERGIKVHTAGPIGLPWRTDDHEAEARRVFEFARATDSVFVELGKITEPYIAPFEALSEEYGIRVSIHNHGRKHEFGKIEQLKPLFDRTSFGLSLDTAWALDAGEDPLEMARTFRDRLLCVHCKEFKYDENDEHYGVTIGSGTFDLRGFMRLLDDVGFNGLFALEYEGFEYGCMPAVKQSQANIMEIVDSL